MDGKITNMKKCYCESMKDAPEIMKDFYSKIVDIDYGYVEGCISLSMVINNKGEYLLWADGDGIASSEPIKFCPFCGRKLNK